MCQPLREWNNVDGTIVYMLLLALPLLSLTTITTATTYYLLPQLPLSRRVLSLVGRPGFLQRLLSNRHIELGTW